MEDFQKNTLVLLWVIIALLVISIALSAYLYAHPKPATIASTPQVAYMPQTTTPVDMQQPATTSPVNSSTNSGLETFINTQYNYEVQYPVGMTVQDQQNAGNPTTSGLVSFSGASTQPGFSISASSNTTQSNNNGTLVCDTFTGGVYHALTATHGSIFYYGTVSTPNGPTISYCTIHNGVKYKIASLTPTIPATDSLLAAVAGSFISTN